MRSVENSRRVFLLMLLSIAVSNAEAAIHALLVGVGDYPQLDAQYRLKGPVNDVLALSSVFQKKGIPASQIHTLTDRQATRTRIVNAIQRLEQQTRSGDMVVLYFSGHGSQSPVKEGHGRRNEEPDDLNEFFLPADIGRWDGTRGEVANALLDDDLGDLITAIRRKGVFVWAIFDTCHAATSTRSAEDESVARAVPPDVLGIPPEQMPAPTRGARSRSTAIGMSGIGPEAGGLVAYDAADETGKALERLLPAANGEPRHFGIFTHALVQALEEKAPLPGYKTLLERIAQLTGAYPGQPQPQLEGAAYLAQPALIPPPPPRPPKQIKPELRLATAPGAGQPARQALDTLLGLPDSLTLGVSLQRAPPSNADALVRSCPDGQLYLAQASAKEICTDPTRMAMPLAGLQANHQQLRENLCRMAAGAHINRLAANKPSDATARQFQVRFELQRGPGQTLTRLSNTNINRLHDGDIIRPSFRLPPGIGVEYTLFFIDSLGRAWGFDNSLQDATRGIEKDAVALKGLGVLVKPAGTLGNERAVLILRDTQANETQVRWNELTKCGEDRLELIYPDKGYAFSVDWEARP